MKKTFVLLIGLAFAGVAQAQIKCWTTADGKRGCGDIPPPGAKITTIKTPSGSLDAAPAPAAKGATKDAKKGPLTPAEQEQEYRKRQAESQKDAAKAEQERQERSARAENCKRSQEYLTTLESGQRIARMNPSGERYYLDENQVAQEAAKARETMRKECGN